MAFGFPPYAERSMSFSDPDTATKMVSLALQVIGWYISRPAHDVFEARTAMSLCSIGERVRCRILPNGSVAVRSEFLMPTQCFDWGGNQNNVDKLISWLSSGPH